MSKDSKYKCIEFLFSLDQEVLNKLLSCASSQIMQYPDATPLENTALIKAQEALYILDKEY